METELGKKKKQALQNTFDLIWAHSEKMVEKSINKGASFCAYRSGLNKCFIGVLIPDSLYNLKMENHTSFSIFYFYPEIFQWFETKNLSVDELPLTRIQNIHDEHFEFRKEKLINFANDYSLVVPLS